MTRPRPSRLLLGLLFLGAGVPHFTHTATYERVMPPSLPVPHELVLLSGAANVQMALHPGLVPGVPAALLWLRLPLQGLLIAWVVHATREPGR